MVIAKENRIRLKGKALKSLNDAIFSRDDNCCIICGRYVQSGTKFHHEPNGSSKSDEIHKGVVLCEQCHFERHFTENCMILKKKILSYLQAIYPNEKIMH